MDAEDKLTNWCVFYIANDLRIVDASKGKLPIHVPNLNIRLEIDRNYVVCDYSLREKSIRDGIYKFLSLDSAFREIARTYSVTYSDSE